MVQCNKAAWSIDWLNLELVWKSRPVWTMHRIIASNTCLFQMKLNWAWNTMCACVCNRLFHVDDIPSGMGGDAIDWNKASLVRWLHAVRTYHCRIIDSNHYSAVQILYWCSKLNQILLKFCIKKIYVWLMIRNNSQTCITIARTFFDVTVTDWFAVISELNVSSHTLFGVWVCSMIVINDSVQCVFCSQQKMQSVQCACRRKCCSLYVLHISDFLQFFSMVCTTD